MTRLLVVALLLAACGPQAQEEGDPMCLTHRCEAVPLAFEASDPVVAQVVADLTKATGAGVVTDDFGVPVIFEPVVTNLKTGEPECGHTETVWSHSEVLFQEIHISTEVEGCGTPWHTVAHEMIHALAPLAPHCASGLFAEKANGMQHFDRAALEVVCSSVSCPRFGS